MDKPAAILTLPAVWKLPAVKLPDTLPAAAPTLADNITDVPVAKPKIGVTSVGVVANTREPEPVSSVITEARSADRPATKVLALPLLANSNPPTVEPSCTRIVLLLVLTEISPEAPVKLLFCAVVPRLNCTCVGINCSVNYNTAKSSLTILPLGSIQS